METTELDNNGQPINNSFNRQRNKEKAIYTLRGILQGITADQELNESELLFLDTWLQSQKDYRTGDIIDLLDLIADILEDGIVSGDELEEMQNLMNDILEYGTQPSISNENSLNELIGIIKGIVADEKITDDEFAHIDNWINNNPHIADEWITSEIINRIKEIKADGIVTKEELDNLLPILKGLAGHTFNETGLAEGGVSEIFSENINDFTHQDKVMCFSGTFVNGTRTVIENSAISYGAKIAKNISKKVNVLVIGTFISRDWRYTSYGKKIEKVLKLKKNGHDIIIISERQWIKVTKLSSNY